MVSDGQTVHFWPHSVIHNLCCASDESETLVGSQFSPSLEAPEFSWRIRKDLLPSADFLSYGWSWRWWGCWQAPGVLFQRQQASRTWSTWSPSCTSPTPPSPSRTIDRKRSQLRLTLDNVFISLNFSTSSFILSACFLTPQKLHCGPFLGLNSNKSAASIRTLVNLYWPSSWSSFSKSSFKVSGRLLISSPSSKITWKH